MKRLAEFANTLFASAKRAKVFSRLWYRVGKQLWKKENMSPISSPTNADLTNLEGHAAAWLAIDGNIEEHLG